MVTDTSPIHERLSEACVRAGVLALLASLLAFPIAREVSRRPSDQAVASYTSSYLDLIRALGTLQRSQDWKDLLLASHGPLPADRWPFETLLKYETPSRVRYLPEVTFRGLGGTGFVSTATAAPRVQTLHQAGRIPGAEIVNQAIRVLTDRDLLKRLSGGRELEAHLFAWEVYALLQERQAEAGLAHETTVLVAEGVERGAPSPIAEALKLVSLADLIFVVNQRPLSVERAERWMRGESFSVLDFQVHEPAPIAAWTLKLGVLACCVYFCLNAWTARGTPGFPLAGTFFGVMDSSPMAKVVYLCSVLIPAVLTTHLYFVQLRFRIPADSHIGLVIQGFVAALIIGFSIWGAALSVPSRRVARFAKAFEEWSRSTTRFLSRVVRIDEGRETQAAPESGEVEQPKDLP